MQERDRYVIAVKRDSNGRGGSMSFIDDTAEGDAVDVSLPRNEFPRAGSDSGNPDG
ncbi:ferredoxin-NADP reductase [Paraburkholderia sp. JPY465]